MASLAARPATHDGYCYRATKPRFGNARDALSGQGSQYAAGRYHAQGAFLIVYSSGTPEGAIWEFTHTARVSSLYVADLMPITMLSARVRLISVLDLIDPAVRHALGVTAADLQSADWVTSRDEALTQTIGRLAFEAGFEAILVPSDGGSPNLNIMLTNLLPGSTLQIINENELPPPV